MAEIPGQPQDQQPNIEADPDVRMNASRMYQVHAILTLGPVQRRV